MARFLEYLSYNMQYQICRALARWERLGQSSPLICGAPHTINDNFSYAKYHHCVRVLEPFFYFCFKTYNFVIVNPSEIKEPRNLNFTQHL